MKQSFSVLKTTYPNRKFRNNLKQIWEGKLPEIEITPIMHENQILTVKKDLFKNGSSKRVGPVYKNPFNYSSLNNNVRKNLRRSATENKNTKWTCMICSEIHPDKKSLIDHYEFHKRETESISAKGSNRGDYFTCPVCLIDFTSLKSYEKHVENKHDENNFSCGLCDESFKNSFQLCIHNFNIHSSDKYYKCNFCNFKTKHKNSLRSHLRKHDCEVQHRCEVCNKGFTTKTAYEEHKNFHKSAMPFQCELCDKSFTFTRHLVAHKKEAHPATTPSTVGHQCEVCEQRFPNKKSLVLHVRAHSTENGVLCEMCGKSLTTAAHLQQHLRIHTGYKPHTCSICGKGFAKKCNLTLHERVHSGEKPYVCSTCGKCFSQRSTLVIHLRYHTGERPYVCHLCTKGFVAKGLLSVHLKSCPGVP